MFKKNVILTCAIIFTLFLVACGEYSDSQKSSEEQQVDKVSQYKGMAANIGPEHKCMSDFKEKLAPIKANLSPEQRSQLLARAQLLTKSLNECEKGLALLNRFAVDIKASQVKRKAMMDSEETSESAEEEE